MYDAQGHTVTRYGNFIQSGVTLNDWSLKILERDKEQLLSRSNYVVADAYFSRHSFVEGLQLLGFDLVSRLRDDSNLLYLYQGDKSGKKGRPKTFEGKIDIKNLDYSRMEKLDIKEQEGELYTLITHSKPLERSIRLVIWISRKGTHKLYFSTEIQIKGEGLSIIIEQGFRSNFAFEIVNSLPDCITLKQGISIGWISLSMRH